MYKGLLCDLDGTLANSEPLHCAAWLGMLQEKYGLDYDEEWFEQWVGTSDRVVAEWLIATHDLPITIVDLITQKQERFQEAVRREGSTFRGVPEMLNKIAARYPLAIATNSGRSDADLMIAATGLDQFTSISVTASDVAHMKPEPDIYLLAAERLGLPANECIAIEDSAPGGVAAKAAGCYLIGVTDKVEAADELVATNEAALRRALEMLAGGN